MAQTTPRRKIVKALGKTPLRRYTKGEIARFLKEDRLDQETARRVQRLLRCGAL